MSLDSRYVPTPIWPPWRTHFGEAIAAAATICVTESGSFARHLTDLSGPLRLIAATSNQDTYQALVEAGLEALRLPAHAADKYSQARRALSILMCRTVLLRWTNENESHEGATLLSTL